MFVTYDSRLGSIPLSACVFWCELPVLLNLNEKYIARLLNSDKVEFTRLKFPKPFYTSPAGIEVWSVRHLESWVFGARRADKNLRSNHVGEFLIDSREVGDRLLGK